MGKMDQIFFGQKKKFIVKKRKEQHASKRGAQQYPKK
jgi:hypothetical protein